MGSPRAILAVAVLVACGAAFLLLRGRGDGPTDGTGRSQGSGPRGPLAVEGAPPTLAAGPRVPKDANAAPSAGSAQPHAPEALDPADRPAGWEDPPGALRGPVVERTVLVRVRCVDAITAEPVGARWRMTDGLVEVSALSWTDRRWRAGELAAASYVYRHDGTLAVAIEVEPPAGYVGIRSQRPSGAVGDGVREVLVTVALWPSVDLVVTVVGHDGVPCAGARIVALTCGDDPVAVPAEATDARGVLRVRGLPFIPGAEIRALFSWDPDSVQERTPPPSSAHETDVDDEGSQGDAAGSPPPLKVTLPSRPIPEFAATAHLTGPTSGSGELPSGGKTPLGGPPIRSEILVEGNAPVDPSRVGDLRVRVRTADGRPIQRAHVEDGERMAETDAEGLASLRNVTASERDVVVSAVGGFRWTTRVKVAAGVRTDVELREPAGGRLDVEVVEEAGSPCPFATVDVWNVEGADVFDVEDGVQRLDDLTDAVGKRSFRRVAPGEVTVTAAWRGRKGEAKVVVEERGRVTARIVVR